jgi:hypothetical protein
MTANGPSPDPTKLTVFRERRRCAKCGLVNADSAARCRRCGKPFGAVDRAAESERVVARMRAWKIGAVALAVLLVAALAFAVVTYRAKTERLARFADSERSVRADLVTLSRGARSDAALVAAAFDEGEVKRLLRDQAAAWASRVQQCEGLRLQVDDLVPQNPEQTASELEIERNLDTVAGAARDIAEAAKTSDVFTARLAAARLAQAEGSKE